MQVSADEGHWAPSRINGVKSSQNVDSCWSRINEQCTLPTRNRLHLKDMEREKICMQRESGSVCRERASLYTEGRSVYRARELVCMQRESGSVCRRRNFLVHAL